MVVLKAPHTLVLIVLNAAMAAATTAHVPPMHTYNESLG